MTSDCDCSRAVCPDSAAQENTGPGGSSPFLLFPLRLVCTTRKSHFQLALIFESHVSGEERREKKARWKTPMLDHLATNTRSLTRSPRAKESLPDHTPSDLKASTRACLLKTLLRMELIPETDCFKPSKPKSHFLYSQCRLRRCQLFLSKNSYSFPRPPGLGLLAPLAVSHSYQT